MDKKYESEILSSIFTDKELEELDFEKEEIDAIEAAETISKISDVLPENEKDMDKLFEKIDKAFPDELNFDGIVQRYIELCKKDPNFIDQIFAINYLVSQVSQVPPPKTEAVSVDMIDALKSNIQKDQKKAKFEAILKAIGKMDKQ